MEVGLHDQNLPVRHQIAHATNDASEVLRLHKIGTCEVRNDAAVSRAPDRAPEYGGCCTGYRSCLSGCTALADPVDGSDAGFLVGGGPVSPPWSMVSEL